MTLSNAYTIAIGRIPDLFSRIRDGQAPDQVTTQLLKDWGFTSSNDRALLQVLKALGFLSPDGKPTNLYHDYRDHSRSRAVMGQALRNAYSDIFLIKEHPTDADRAAVQGKFKSFHNVSDLVAGLMAKNFFALLALADLRASQQSKPGASDVASKATAQGQVGAQLPDNVSNEIAITQPGLHYNIQIHLPPTKDVEVYNAIFKSLREHLLAK